MRNCAACHRMMDPNRGIDAHYVKASQRIYHDAQHPSALVLPVIPR